MGSYVYAVRAQKRKLKMNGESVELRQAKFLCRYSCHHAFNGEIQKAERYYANTGHAKYIVLTDDMKDIENSQVIQYGSNCGTFNDDRDLGVRFMPVGVVLRDGKRLYIETNKKVIENARRQREWAKMKQGKLSIGKFGNDIDAYEEWLHSKDKEAQANGEEIYFRNYIV